jgi:hypothetical protein
MLTIENIDNIKGLAKSLRVAGEKWELVNIGKASDLYQFVFRCIEAHPAGGLLREAVINLSRTHTTKWDDMHIYELKNIITNKSRLIDINHLKEPKSLIGPMLRVIEGC